MLYVVFEDSLKTHNQKEFIGISYLLSKYYEQSQDIFTVFTETNSCLVKTMRQLKSKEPDSKIVVYVDLVADNVSTWGVYKKLMNTVLINLWDNIVIMPIPCMEFIYSIAFNDMIENRADYDLMLQREHYTKTMVYTQGFLGTTSSFEKLCKAIKQTYFPEDANEISFNEEVKSFYNTYLGLKNEPMDMTEKYKKLVEGFPFMVEFNQEVLNIKAARVAIVNEICKFIKQIELYEDVIKESSKAAVELIRVVVKYNEFLRTQCYRKVF